ncbi:NTP pyrophosphatase (non-canonical NTP hydrolase) [Herbaspirillum sp. Sphag1AN]|uniref:nucleotide pyrophosphohydrolase n=1 Tax=unclassified Herbaspirillum TaxID=2624150 RepID=UPI00162047F1|nr:MULTISPECIES: nucleotide pyrophosphohydrolase [unclassified Herbaspirillum]MBB3212903.1 NTP pyrophosphatase (non-canonical NTP hydrolase) [Herbaspirillum sp. Sphag1AN]MBB3246100.1 NTP pyrophosphatase (non-canonical NTP hydrolase) [Herbaspirillum sp. Sphag64]
MSTSGTMPSDLLVLRDIVRQFAEERDWQQFHTPKNLAMALSVEVAELVEQFQWLPTGADHELDDAQRLGIRHELADSLVYLIRLADQVNVDLYSAVLEKMQLNREKYPVDKVKGQSRKYTHYRDSNQPDHPDSDSSQTP